MASTTPEGGDHGDAVRLTRMLSAPAEEVFAAWTQPDRMGRWMSPFGPATASVDLRVGGRFELVMHGPDQAVSHTGVYREIDPPRRLVFTWESPYTDGRATLVTVELAPVDEARTELTLVHAELPGSQVEPHRGGWEMLLDRLAGALAP